MGAAAVVVGALVLVLARRDGELPEDRPVSPAVVGACVRYTGAPPRVDATVPCDQPHDGRVVGAVLDRGACPAGTDALLATETDLSASGVVICVSEKG